MPLKEKWVDRVNNVDYIDADDINKVAHAVIEVEETIAGGGGNISVDTTLTESGKAADAAIVGQKFAEQSKTIADKATLENGVIAFWKADTALFTVDISSIGGLDLNKLTLSVTQVGEYQRLSMSDGTTTKTVDIPITAISDEQVQTAVQAWLDEHPEATTTVADGSITEAKLADGSVTPAKTSFLEFSRVSVNLFDKTTVTMNASRYQSAPWNVQTSTTLCISDFIPVEPNTVYIRGTASFMLDGKKTWQHTLFADADKNFIGSLRHYPGAGYQQSFTTPEGCYYVQMNVTMEGLDGTMFCKGNTEPSEYVPYAKFYKPTDDIEIPLDNVTGLDRLADKLPNGSIPKSALDSDFVGLVDGVDEKINTAVKWNDVRQPTKTLTGRINVFENVVKGTVDIASDISDKTIVVHGVNYFDLNDLVPGGIDRNNGSITEKTNWCYTKHLIPVKPGEKLYWNRVADISLKSYMSFHYYGENQEWLRCQIIGGGTACGELTISNDVFYIRIDLENPKDVSAEKLCIADVDIGNPTHGFAIVGVSGTLYFGKTVYFPYVGYHIENGVIVGASDTFTLEEITHVDVFDSASTIEVTAPVESFDQERLRNVVLKYGRYGDTDYVMARIFKNTITGKTITPKVVAFNPGGKTMNDLAKENDFVMAINAGCFDMTDNSCIGTTIVDGDVITDHLEHVTIGSCDVFTIDSSGNFASYAYETTTTDLLSAGVVHAVQGKCTLIENYAKYDMETADTLLGNDGLVNAKHPRTAIGQYKNGDYMVFTCGGRETNQMGMTCAEMQEIMVNEGVKYAYNLDGGGSCNMMFFKKELAPYTENRADPTYIIFE